MGLRTRLIPILAAVIAGSILVSGTDSHAGTLLTSTITVDTTADNNVRDSVVSLREAILLATGDLSFADLNPAEQDNITSNGAGAPGPSAQDTIVFSAGVFPTPGVTQIFLLGGALPLMHTGFDRIQAIGDSSSGLSNVAIVGVGESIPVACLTITSHSNIILGLTFTGCAFGIDVLGGLFNTIGGQESNDRNTFIGNDEAIRIWIGAASNTVKGNVFYDNRVAIHIVSENTENNVVTSNMIGTDHTGAATLNGNEIGVEISNAPKNLVGGTNTGGASAGPDAGNLISGNGVGVLITGNAQFNVVSGNYIGTDVTGTQAVPNSIGVQILDGATGNVIGGDSGGDRNVISANNLAVEISGEDTDSNTVSGNYIGVDVTGSLGLPNGTGVSISEGADSNIVGGGSPGERNIIANSGDNVGLYGEGTNDNVVSGNYIGTDVTGAQSLSSGRGVVINGAGNVIGGDSAEERNVISGHSNFGVIVSGEAAVSNTVSANFIGIDATGLVAMPNFIGVLISGAGPNIVGGDSAGERNVISGNLGQGVRIEELSPGNVVKGNYIGTDVSGTAAIGNGDAGVWVEDSSNSIIGGTSAGARNVISGNDPQIKVSGAGLPAIGNRIQGNYLGTNAAGNAAILGPGDIVSLESGAADNTIGGPEAGAGNVISGGDQAGVALSQSTGNLIQNNLIGTAANGASPLGNKRVGVRLDFESDNNSIVSNTIANNGFNDTGSRPGVLITDSVGNRVSANEIHSNAGLGVDLEDVANGVGGVSLNDPMDKDAGFGNNVQNYPELTSAVSGSISIKGTFDSTPNSDFRIEFFVNDDCDPSGHGEGQDFLGGADIATDGGGGASFTADSSADVSAGKYITATATNLGTNDTSEFSNCVQVEEAPTPPPTLPPGETPSPTPEDQTPTPPPIPVDTPTPTPTPTGGVQLTQGDNNCDGDIQATDALAGLRHVAGLGINQQPGCPTLGGAVPAGIAPDIFGDVDCDGDVDAVDALKILQFVAAIPFTQDEPCTNIGVAF